MQAVNLKTLHERVINETDDLLKYAKDENITFSDLLDRMWMKDPDKDEGWNAINRLLLLEGIFPRRTDHSLGSKLADVFLSDKPYLDALWASYLDNLYKSCFEGTDTRVGINDLIAYTKHVKNYDHRGIEKIYDDLLDVDDDTNIYVLEGQMIPTVRIKLNQEVKVLRCMALGTEISHEFIRNCDMYLFEFADYVLKIGTRHNNALIDKFFDLFVVDVEVRDLKFCNNIKNKTIEGVNMWDYLGINQKFKDTNPADTVIGDGYATMKYLITHNQARDLREEIQYISDNNYDTLFGVDKVIKALDERAVKHNNMERKLVIFNKDTSLVLLTNETHFQDTYQEYKATRQFFKQYFGKVYAFEEQDDAQRFVYEVA